MKTDTVTFISSWVSCKKFLEFWQTLEKYLKIRIVSVLQQKWRSSKLFKFINGLGVFLDNSFLIIKCSDG